MATANQPRPRPKPKPRTKTATHIDPGPSTQPDAQLIPQPVAAGDEDELFMRNRKRTTATWQKLNKSMWHLVIWTHILDISIEAKAVVISDSEDECLTPRKNKKKRPNEIVPRWQRDEKLVRSCAVFDLCSTRLMIFLLY